MRILLLLFMVYSTPAMAGVTTDLQNFYKGLGGANITPAGVYQSQAGGYYTGGGVFTRAPIRSYQLLQISPITLSAGCGGIDMYLGGFSFINKAQFTTMLQNIGNNAAGYAFNLALQTFAPQIFTGLDTLQKKIQAMTNLSVNSCESAQKLVNGVFGEIAANNTTACENLAVSKGLVTDHAAATEFCKSPANANSIFNPASMTASEKEHVAIHKNILWSGMNKDNVLNTDKPMKEFLLTLTGSIVIEQSAGGTPNIFHLPALGSVGKNIKDMMYGTTAQTLVYQCLTSDVNCLKPVYGYRSITGVVSNVRAALDDIRNNLEGEAISGASATTLLPATSKLLTISSLPILKLMVNAVALGPSVALQIENELIDPISFNIASMYIDWALTRAKESAQKEESVIPKSMYQSYISDIRAQQTKLTALRNTTRMASTMEIIKKAQFLDQLLIANLSPHFQEVLQYSKSF